MSNAAQQQIPEGYKQTEIGVFPEDWGLTQISKISHVVDSLHLTPTFSVDGYAMVRVADIKSGYLNLKTTLKVSDGVFKEFTRNYQPKKDDIVLSRVGSYGVSSYVNTDEEFCMGQNTVVIHSKISSKYLYYMLNSVATWQQIEDGSYGSGYKSLSLKNINELHIPLAKEKEQTAISNALSDVDALITSLEKLIAKKRAIKTAAMQQLLTGKKRLPPFDQTHTGYKQTELGEIPEDWEVVELEKLAHVRTGSMNNQDKVEDGVYPFYVRSQNVERINSYSYECEAILVPGEGNIGNIFHYVNGRFDAHQRVYVIRQFDEECSAKYIFYYMNETFGRHAMENSVKATVDSLRLPTFLGYKLAKPERLEEQMAIAAVLTDMDKEIKEVKQRLNKTQQLKQGMMQELLTGKTRLITKTTS